MKKEPISIQIAKLEKQVQADVEHWHDLKANGCNDPFWPDGVNLNLVRNHIIYGLQQIDAMNRAERQLSMFDAQLMGSGNVMNDKRIPPKVDDYYMVKDQYINGRRVKHEMASI